MFRVFFSPFSNFRRYVYSLRPYSMLSLSKKGGFVVGFFDFLSSDNVNQKQIQEKDELIKKLSDEIKEKNAELEQISSEKDEL